MTIAKLGLTMPFEDFAFEMLSLQIDLSVKDNFKNQKSKEIVRQIIDGYMASKIQATERVKQTMKTPEKKTIWH